MIFTEREVKGVYVIELEPFEDERGFFAPSFSQREFEARGLVGRFVENSVSYNRRRGTLRGMHYQAAPYGQAKLVRCTRGSIFDVAVDLRPTSATFKQWVGVRLTQENRLMLYLPADMAHGFQALEDDTEVFYQVSEVYTPDAYRGYPWNDPAFDIKWPLPNELILNKRDESYPCFKL
jgi:dTDP-4-dehydrorhamnose 3,5-epimerase